MISATMVSSDAFAYTKQEDEQIKNFIEDNITDVGKLKLSDVKKALPFMSDLEAEKFILNMRKLLNRRATSVLE